MWCYRRILKISWTDKIRNSEVLDRIGIHETKLLKQIAKRKLEYDMQQEDLQEKSWQSS